jgi:hypothetical protein
MSGLAGPACLWEARAQTLHAEAGTTALSYLNLRATKKEETPLSDFVLDFKDELFTEYGNTSNYYSVRKPQELKKSSLHKESLDPSEEAFFKKDYKRVSVYHKQQVVRSIRAFL